MKLNISSTEALDAAVADIVRLRIAHTAATATQDAEVAALMKTHQRTLTDLEQRIAAAEASVRDYCDAHRDVFGERRSRETSLATFGFRLTPPRVEPASRKITWKEVATRLQQIPDGDRYLHYVEPKVSREALLADREDLTPEALARIGVKFLQDDEFFIEPKPDSASEVPCT